jgi:putative proteasome-type protease
MTFAVGISVNAGLVALADTRVLRGNDRSKKSKLTVLEHDGRQFFVATSGLRSVTDKTLRRLEDDLAARTAPLHRIHDLASAYGAQLRQVRDEDRDALLEAGLQFNSHAIIGGQLAGDARPELFLVYPEGNWVTSTDDAPYMVIGRSTYGKPTLDLLVRNDTPLLEAAALAYLAFDATRRSSVDVDFPIDLIVFDRPTGTLRSRRCEATDLEPASAYWLAQQRLALDNFPVQLLDPLLPERRPS